MTTDERGRPGYWAAPLVFGAAFVLVAVSQLATRLFHLQRFEVTGRSMLPAFRNGDFLVVDSSHGRRQEISSGDVVVARDPRDPARHILKRVRDAGEQGFWLAGDNAEESTDSREYGWVPRRSVVGVVRWRYWPLPPRSWRLANISTTSTSVGKASGGGEATEK